MDKINIHILHISQVKKHFSFVSSFVDEKRKEKAEKYVNEKDRLLSFGAGYLLKKYLPKENVKLTNSGKPYLPNGPFFNLSHSEEYVVLAIHSTRDVGADIEKIDDQRVDAIRFVLNEEEKKVSDVNTLFQMWSNKESLIKCMSTGLKDIKNVNGLPLEGIRTINGEEFFSKSVIYEGYSLSVTLKGNGPFNINIKQVDILENE